MGSRPENNMQMLQLRASRLPEMPIETINRNVLAFLDFNQSAFLALRIVNGIVSKQQAKFTRYRESAGECRLPTPQIRNIGVTSPASDI